MAVAKVWDGSGWVPAKWKTWDGTKWVEQSKVWDGNDWAPIISHTSAIVGWSTSTDPNPWLPKPEGTQIGDLLVSFSAVALFTVSTHCAYRVVTELDPDEYLVNTQGDEDASAIVALRGVDTNPSNWHERQVFGLTITPIEEGSKVLFTLAYAASVTGNIEFNPPPEGMIEVIRYAGNQSGLWLAVIIAVEEDPTVDREFTLATGTAAVSTTYSVFIPAAS